jgi:hypothetical protein
MSQSVFESTQTYRSKSRHSSKREYDDFASWFQVSFWLMKDFFLYLLLLFTGEFAHPFRERLERLSHLISNYPKPFFDLVRKANKSSIVSSGFMSAYSLDKHERLVNCKLRLAVRGDRQVKTSIGYTYAATLAVRSFPPFIAIASRFDLELIQHDAANAFVNTKLEDNIIILLPLGHRRVGKILISNEAYLI